MICNIYRSDKTEGMYLFIASSQANSALEQLPDPLKMQFRKQQLAMTIEISPERKLARSDAKKILQSIEKEGFYLQLPPKRDELEGAIAARNEKLPR